jgi:hypothetical protein
MNPLLAAECRGFSHLGDNFSSAVPHRSRQFGLRENVIAADLEKNWPDRCTKSGHMAVNELHSIENATTYKSRIFVDEKNRKSRTKSFFDSFSVFPVGAASGAQAKSLSCCANEKEGEQGSIAKRWSRRIGRNVEGRIEFRGVG